jgi:hypothetical protein
LGGKKIKSFNYTAEGEGMSGSERRERLSANEKKKVIKSAKQRFSDCANYLLKRT